MAKSSSFSSAISPFLSATLQSPITPITLSFAFHSWKSRTLPSLRASSHKAFAHPQLMESKETLTGSDGSTGFEAEGSELSPLSVDSDGDKLHSSTKEFCSNGEQKICLMNNNGETIVGILNDSGSRELVILCHGFRSSKESSTIMSLANALTNEKIGIFRFDFSGNGESGGSFQYGNYWKEVDDLRTVILYFMKQRRPINAIVGHSKGGNVVLLYASRYHDIPMVINVSGRFDIQRGIEERLGKDFMQRIANDGFIDKMDKTGRFVYRVTKESLMDRLSTDMRAACSSIIKECRVLTVHGSEDAIVPLEDALEFAKSIVNHKLHIVEGADHIYQSHRLQLARIVLDFIRASEVDVVHCEI